MILPLSQSGRNWAGRELYRFCAKSEVEIEKLIKNSDWLCPEIILAY
jgi:hypothetical protein